MYSFYVILRGRVSVLVNDCTTTTNYYNDQTPQQVDQSANSQRRPLPSNGDDIYSELDDDDDLTQLGQRVITLGYWLHAVLFLISICLTVFYKILDADVKPYSLTHSIKYFKDISVNDDEDINRRSGFVK